MLVTTKAYLKKEEGRAHSRVATLIQPKFSKKEILHSSALLLCDNDCDQNNKVTTQTRRLRFIL